MFSITGQIKDVSGGGIGGVNVALIGSGIGSGSATTTTDNAGNYSFANLTEGGNYTVTPSNGNYSFSPVNQIFNNLNIDRIANFVGTQTLVSITGSVTDSNNAGINNVTLALTKNGVSAGTTLTNALGNYIFGNQTANANYVVTPSGSFTPSSQTFSNLGLNAVANFKAAPSIPSQCNTASFAAATNVAAGSAPESLAVGDFNGDGKLDLAVANFNSDNVSILLGTGTGSFSAATSFAVGTSPASVAIGDFNGDGKSDLAVANFNSDNVSILLGTGTGSFSAATNFAVGSGPYSVAVGDFNGDGKLDLAVANFYSNVSILLGTGTGSFSAATNFAGGSSPRSVAVGDFNGDGKLDLAVANANSANVSILLGTGTGSFTAATNFAVNSSPQSVAASDFNGDGKLDLAAANYNSANVSILLGTGTGSFSAATNFDVGTLPFSVAVGDFNGDGKLDLAVANFNSTNVSILLGNGTGSFSAATNFAVGLSGHSVAVGDFNGDGKLDLAVANASSFSVSILLNNGTTCNTQTSLTISGRIADSKNNPLSDVTVTLSGPITRVVQTDANGIYPFSNLIAGGNYAVTVQSNYFVFQPSRADFFNLSSSQTANFTAAPVAVPAPTPPLSDDFTSPVRDPNKWNLGTQTQPPGAVDPQVTTAQINGQLVITPRSQASGLHYNGYVAANSFDIRNGKATVEVVKAATGGADTIFAIGSDSDNFFRFMVHTAGAPTSLVTVKGVDGIEAPLDTTTAQLIFRVKLPGQPPLDLTIPYDPVQHLFMRFRHESPVVSPTDGAIVFETSPNDIDYTVQHRAFLQKHVDPLTAELSAGTSSPTNPSQAVFGGFGLVTSTFQFSAAGYTVGEGDGPVVITVTRAGTVTDPDSVDYATVNGTALQGSKYLNATGKLTFAAGQTSRTFIVSIVDNDVAEGNQTVNLLLGNPERAGFNSPGRAVLNIVDNDTAPTPPRSISGNVRYSNNSSKLRGVVLNVTGSQVASTTTDAAGNYTAGGLTGGGAYTITPSKTGDVNGVSGFDAALVARHVAALSPLNANQQVAGDASNNGTLSAFDAALIAQTVAGIPNAGSVGTWKFLPVNRSYAPLAADEIQEFVGTLVGDVSGSWVPPAAATGQLSESQIQLTTKDFGSLAPAVAVAVALPVKTDPPGGTSTIPITVGDLTGLNVISYEFTMTFNPAVITPRTPVFDAVGTMSNGWTITENTGTPGQVRLVAFNTTPLTGSGTLLNLKFNVVGGSGSVTLLTWQSFVFNEGDPAASLTNGQLSVGQPPTGTVQFSSAAYSQGEGAGTATITVTRAGGSSGAASVQFATAAGGTATGGASCTAGVDYITPSGPLNWVDGDASSKSFGVTLCNDNIFEGNETVNLALSNATGATLGSQTTATLTINDDDTQPTISINDVSQSEGNSGTTNFDFTVSLSNPTTQTVNVNYATANGTATAGSDYQAIGSTLLSFTAGQTSKVVTVVVTGDTTFEPDETFFVNLSGASGATIADSQGLGTIQNDDAAPQPGTVQFSSATYSAGEGAGTATITVTRAGGSSGAASVQFATAAGGTATGGAGCTAGVDYITPSGPLNWVDGDASSKSFSVTLCNDNIFEGNETVNLALSNATGATLGSQTTATLTITNDDSQPSINIDDVTQAEGNSGTTNFNFTVSLSNPTTQTVTVNYATADGTATTADSDYQAQVSTLLSFSALQTSSVVTVSVTGDAKFEPNETFFVNLSGPSGATIARSQGIGTIQNDDAAPQPGTVQFSSATYSAGEGAGTATITVTRTGGSAGAASVQFAIAAGGTATGGASCTAGVDYITPSGSLNWVDGDASSKTFSVTLCNDNIFEGNETVNLALSNANGATLGGQTTATLTINDGATVVLTTDQVTLNIWKYQGRNYAYAKLSFPDAGYRVADWGQAVRSGNDFSADATVEKLTGVSVQAVTTTAQIYDLGPLADGNYTFTFKNSGTVVKSQIFTVSSAAPPPNPIDNAREFVKQQYRDFLNREADQGGEDFWTDNITKCSDPARRPPSQTEAQCTLRQRETTSGAFFLSPEFQYTGYYVLRMYQGALGRQPKLSEFIPDAQFVGAGILVNGQLSGAKINQNKADFAQQFVNCTDAAKSRCAEFKAIYDGLNNQQYVDKLFQTTGVNASASDRAALVNGLNANPATETRASVLQKVVDGINVISEGNQQFTTSYGQAFYNSEFNRAFVQLEYFGYMKRDPDDAGYAFWLGKLNQFGGNFVNAEMVLAFISSPEYRARFGAP